MKCNSILIQLLVFIDAPSVAKLHFVLGNSMNDIDPKIA